MENSKWYALQRDTEDDWGTGAETLEKAMKMAKEMDDIKLIAVIENGVCIDEIWLDR